VDGGGGDGESPAHAPRFPYRLGIHGTVWGFGLRNGNSNLIYVRYKILRKV
jgi:hypothetical protein